MTEAEIEERDARLFKLLHEVYAPISIPHERAALTELLIDVIAFCRIRSEGDEAHLKYILQLALNYVNSENH